MAVIPISGTNYGINTNSENIPLRKKPDDRGRPAVETALSPIFLFDNKVEDARQYEIFKIGQGDIYYLDFISLDTQNKAFNRIGAFVETKRYAGNVLGDEELKEALASYAVRRFNG
ncbi:MAG: hypothetical protein WC527_02050 [Candidatus Margulisiibacteriota bacterium]